MKRNPAVTYTEEEKEQVVAYFLAVRKSHIQDFLDKQNLPRSGTKEELRARIEEALDDGDLDYETLVGALDAVAPWGKQHVQLYDGPKDPGGRWMDPTWIQELLKQHRLGYLFNAPLPLILPPNLRLSSIVLMKDRLRITAVERRETWERDESLDQATKTVENEAVRLHAYVRTLSRGLVAFEWNLLSNTAFLQISQLPAHWKYDEAAKRFAALTRTWLNLDNFSLVGVGPAIKKLHELEGAGGAEARSHNIDYRTAQGRRLAAHSATARDSVLGEPVIDEALSHLREQGVGRVGIFYWLPGGGPVPGQNPLVEELHVTLVADGQRINFMTASSEDEIRYVLQRVRALSH